MAIHPSVFRTVFNITESSCALYRKSPKFFTDSVHRSLSFFRFFVGCDIVKKSYLCCGILVNKAGAGYCKRSYSKTGIPVVTQYLRRRITKFPCKLSGSLQRRLPLNGYKIFILYRKLNGGAFNVLEISISVMPNGRIRAAA